MEHQNAIETLATERYVLGEMNEDEINEFEEHYFGCRECADAVRNGTTFFDSGKSVVRERQKEARKRGLLYWFPSAAAAMVMFVLGYGIRPPLPITVSSIQMLSSQSRGETTENVVTQHSGETTVLAFDIVPDTPVRAYRWELLEQSGKKFADGEVSAERAKDRMSISLPRSLPAGQYVLVIRGVREDGNRPEIARFPINAKPVD